MLEAIRKALDLFERVVNDADAQKDSLPDAPSDLWAEEREAIAAARAELKAAEEPEVYPNPGVQD